MRYSMESIESIRQHRYLWHLSYPECLHHAATLWFMCSSHAVLLPHIQWSACCDAPQVPAAILQIDVQPCGLGQVPTQDGNQCIACPSASYSFDPASGACKPCPAQGICSGGATLVPQQQNWHSAPDSDYIVTCPNNNACAGSTSELLACQNATYQAQLDFTQVWI